MFLSKSLRIVMLILWVLSLPAILMSQDLPAVFMPTDQSFIHKGPAAILTNNNSQLSTEEYNSHFKHNHNETPDVFSNKVRIFSNSDGYSEGLGNLFIKSLTIRLLENQAWFQADFMDSDVSEKRENPACRKALDDEEVEEDINCKRRLLAKATGSAIAEVVEKTAAGRKIKAFERRLSSFFVIEYSKQGHEAAEFYLPGEKSFNDNEERKDFKVSIRSLVYANTISLQGEFPVEMEVVCFKTTFKNIYDFNNKELDLSLSNLTIDQFLSAHSELIQTYDPECGYTGSIEFTIDF